MELTLDERHAIIKILSRKYSLSSKKQKSYLVDELVYLSGFNRTYATRVLRQYAINPQRPKSVKRSGRTTIYGDDVKKALEKIWVIMDYICGKRLAPFLPEIITKLESFNEIEFPLSVKEKLMRISASSIDRLLKDAKRKLGRKGSSTTRHGKYYLIDQIPIKTFAEWDHTVPGFVQVDLVAHNGGNTYGGFLSTLNATDVSTGWTTCTLVRDKTQFQMLKAFIKMKSSFPFPLKGFHSDNGAEFINETIVAFKEKYQLEFTRGRAYKKNDNPHIEQKNYTIVRRNTGYLRYDKPEHAEILRELYHNLNLYVNYFQPIMILLEKHRKGAKAIRKYDYPKTPYQRLIESKEIDKKTKQKEKAIYETLNPADLKRKINECQNRLIHLAAPLRAPNEIVKVRRKKMVTHTMSPKERNHNLNNPNPFLERQKFEELRRAAKLIWEQRK